MSETEGTTSALSSATPDLDEPPKPRRAKVNHLYWIREMKVAEQLGLAVMSLCKAKATSPFDPWPREVELVGGLMAVSKPRDCRNCIRVYEANARRQWEEHNRRL